MYDNYPGDFATGFFDNQAVPQTGGLAEAKAVAQPVPPSADDFDSEPSDYELEGGVTDTDYSDEFPAEDPAIYDINAPAEIYL
jgi:hypothetical protein